MLDLAQNSPPKVKIPTLTIIVDKKQDPPNKKPHPYSILQVPTTQLAKMSVEATESNRHTTRMKIRGSVVS